MSTSKYNSEMNHLMSGLHRAASTPEAMRYAKDRDYRDPNFYETFLGYLKGYHEFYYYEIIKNEDFGIIIGLILYPLFLVVDFFERWIPYYTSEMAKPIYSPYDKLDRNTQLRSNQFVEFVTNENNEIVDRRAVIATSIRNRENQGTLVDSYCPDKNKKAIKVQAISSLRKYLYKNNFILKANEIGENVTFGKDINEALSIILPNKVVLKNNCIEITSGYKVIEEKLSQLIQEDVKIEIVTDKVKSRTLEKPQTLKNELVNEMLDQGIIKDEENVSGEIIKLILKYSFLTLSLVGTILLLLFL